MGDRDEIADLFARADDLPGAPALVEPLAIEPSPEVIEGIVIEGIVIEHPERHPATLIVERCALCSTEFRLADGHACRAQVIRAGSLFDQNRRRWGR